MLSHTTCKSAVQENTEVTNHIGWWNTALGVGHIHVWQKTETEGGYGHIYYLRASFLDNTLNYSIKVELITQYQLSVLFKTLKHTIRAEFSLNFIYYK